jgi:hypothetical protein
VLSNNTQVISVGLSASGQTFPAGVGNGIVQWLDASVGSNLLDGAGNPIATSGTAASTWYSSVEDGLGYMDAYQVTASARPIWKNTGSDTINNKGTLVFNGSNQYLIHDLKRAGKYSVFMVFKDNGMPLGDTGLFTVGANGSAGSFWFFRDRQLGTYDSAFRSAGVMGTASGRTAVASYQNTGNSGTSLWSINGFTGNATVSYNLDNSQTIGSRSGANGASPFQFSPVSIGEIIVYDGDLTAQQVIDVNRYLAQKWLVVDMRAQILSAASGGFVLNQPAGVNVSGKIRCYNNNTAGTGDYALGVNCGVTVNGSSTNVLVQSCLVNGTGSVVSLPYDGLAAQSYLECSVSYLQPNGSAAMVVSATSVSADGLGSGNETATITVGNTPTVAPNSTPPNVPGLVQWFDAQTTASDLPPF